MILVLDNYDSFTYNICQLLSGLGHAVEVYRADCITVDEIAQKNPDVLVISPGPGTPQEAGVSIEAVQTFAGKIPILGICLGHQAICAAFGVPIVRAKRIVHGKTEKIAHTGTGIFRRIPKDVMVTRYHSLVADRTHMPDTLQIIAESYDGDVMAVEHTHYRCTGIQFHPESIGTEYGVTMIENFIRAPHHSLPLHKAIPLMESRTLTCDEANAVMDDITAGFASDAQIGAFCQTLRMRAPAAEELAGFARSLRNQALPFPMPLSDEIRLDTCGTGGSHKKQFNVSTASACIAAAAGVGVVKHGNRAASSRSGSADVLEAAGANIMLSAENAYAVYRSCGMTFLFARTFHGAMRHVAAARSALGFKTVFNCIGPLANPASATHQIIGVYDRTLVEPMCDALRYLGVTRALVVHARNGLDEIGSTCPTDVAELDHGVITSYTLTPKDFGVPDDTEEPTVSGDACENARILREILSGQDSSAARLVYVNAATALYCTGVVSSFADGYSRAQELCANGTAEAFFNRFIRESRDCHARRA